MASFLRTKNTPSEPQLRARKLPARIALKKKADRKKLWLIFSACGKLNDARPSTVPEQQPIGRIQNAFHDKLASDSDRLPG
jgi:hypothetical protein